jgi:hypothetical protein
MTTFGTNRAAISFYGKGGAGKTSLACATAILLADAGKRILLVSTDPASNVDDGVVRERHARRVAIVPWMTEEPIGPARLLALARARNGCRSQGWSWNRIIAAPNLMADPPDRYSRLIFVVGDVSQASNLESFQCSAHSGALQRVWRGLPRACCF